MKVFNFQTVLRWGILLFFVSPYLIFSFYFKPTFSIESAELYWALQNSVQQAAAAAALCILLALPMSLGWLSCPTKFRRLLAQLLILPQIFPVLFSVLIAFQVWSPFPLGTVGVVFVYVLINLGLATLLVGQSILQRAGANSVVAEVFGIRRWSYYRRVLWPLLRGDLMVHFLLMFVFCFASLSVPLVAGGGKSTNLELLIFEKIFIDFDWSAAFSLSLMQTLIILLLSLTLRKVPSESISASSSRCGRYLRWRWGLLPVALYLICYLGGYGYGLLQGLVHLAFVTQHLGVFMEAVYNTLWMLALYLLFNFFLLYFWVYDYVLNKKSHWARHLISPSTAVVGLAFFLLLPPQSQYDAFKLVLALSLLIFPLLFKLFLEQPLLNIKPQLETAEIYGLKPTVVIYEVIFTQLRRPFFLWLAFLILWFVSDYATSRSVGIQSETLGLLTQGFLGSYRLPLAYLSSLLILLVSALALGICYLLVVVGDVAYKKFKS